MAEDYSCYAYLCIEHAHNMYPIRDSEHHLSKIFSLKNGDVLYIKGQGYLEVIGVNVDKFEFQGHDVDTLYEEIAIACIRIKK